MSHAPQSHPTEVAPGIHRLTGGVANFYLVEQPQVQPSGLNSDTAQALASLSALENLNAEIILPAHGDPWHGPISQAVQLARAAGPS